jgi:hypothetical protein
MGRVSQPTLQATSIVLLIACRSRGLITSGVLFNFWLLLVVCGLPEFRWWIETVFVMVGVSPHATTSFSGSTTE